MDKEVFDEFGNVIGSKAGLEPNLEPTYTVDITSPLAIEKPNEDEENKLNNDKMQSKPRYQYDWSKHSCGN